MLQTILRKSLKCQFHIWRTQKGQRGSRQQKQQLYSPDFLLLISKEQQEPCPPNRGPRASPPATPASSCVGEEIKIMWAVPLCLRSHNVTLRLHSSRVPAWENSLIALWEVQARANDPGEATEKQIHTQMSRGSACDVLNRTLPVSDSQPFLKEAFLPCQARTSL